MSMSAMIQAMGAAAGGVSSGMDAAEAAAERKRKRDADVEDRAFTMSERARAVKMRDDMGAAAAPVAVEQVDQPGPTQDGQALPQMASVKGRAYIKAEDAEAAAAAENTPQAVTTRMADVAMRNGDPLKAQQLRTGAMQEQSAKYQLNDAERNDLAGKWNDEVDAEVVDFKSIGSFATKSAADDNGGKTRYEMVPSTDGKTQVLNEVLPDGSLKPTKRAYPDTADGFAIAKAEMKRMPPERVLAHIHNKAMLAQQVARDAEATKSHQARDAETARHNKATEGLMGVRYASMAGRTGGGAGAGTGASPAPLWDDKADAFLRQRYTGTDPNTGVVSVDGEGLQFGKMIALALAQQNGGDTTSGLGFAFQKDAELRELAKGNPAELSVLRKRYITSLKPAAKKEDAPPASPDRTELESPPKTGASMETQAAAKKTEAQTPTYKNWMAAKNARDKLMDAVKSMSPDRRDSYLQSRLPELEAQIEFNKNYRTY